MPQSSNNSTWQQQLQQAAITPQQLCEYLDLDINTLPAMYAADKLFKLKIPPRYLAKIEKNNPHDPLLLQVLPQHQETITSFGFSKDPVSEKKSNPIAGIIHKYNGRVLIPFTSSCAINCRYCFRRHFDYKSNHLGQQQWHTIFAYIEKDPTIFEVILSGGDPLIATDEHLEKFISQLQQIKHLEILRFHTRLPITIPQRITDKLISILQQSHLAVNFVFHINHPREVDTEFMAACKNLHRVNITTFNQSVLLKNVNDSVETLVALNKKLFAAGIIPYYLHMLDKVEGSQQFAVEIETAQQIYHSLMAALPGYLVPRLVQEVPGLPFKCPIYSHAIDQ